MANIIQIYCIKNDCYKEGTPLSGVSFLIVHSPAVYPVIIRAQSGAGGGWFKRWNKPGVEKLVHGFIDDTGIYEFAPPTMSCWHIGNGWGNTHCIGYELCELQTAAEFKKVWDNAVVHYAELCKRFGLTSDKVIGHCEAHDKGIASNHSDPEPYFRRFGKSMSDFRAEIKEIMSGGESSSPDSSPNTPLPTITEVYEPWAYAKICNLTKSDPYLNVRTGPGTTYPIIRRLGNGNEVDVAALYANDWAKINIVGQEGFVYAGYLKISGIHADHSAVQSGTAWVGKVTGTGGAGLNVRTGPGTSFGKLAAWPKLGDGNLVDILRESGGWYQTRIAGKYTGWVSKDYIRRA
ncbi:amidase [Lacrimispora sp. NSJ-141]|uniref:Amidase n=1 Tax=Lientehia hominis TaxID=2897778 RepID=A0AAP2RKB9_9FIRM|nr:SH3 domain-containing protein [Lientehia hominis]MCD2492480.1 amidase [Lientehia hominis]